MHYLVIGAGQIGSQITSDLRAAGHTVAVLRRGSGTTQREMIETSEPHGNLKLHRNLELRGDAEDRALLEHAAAGASAIFHCMHAPYSASVWRRELPRRERAVMDAAAELDIPVVFPESVYAFGHAAQNLQDDSVLAPVSPLGEVRASLLTARAAHPARTASVVASDLIGPTATTSGSVILSTVIEPAANGRSVWVLGDPDAAHAVTFIPDLSRAMIATAELANADGLVLLAPTAVPRSQRQMANETAGALHLRAPSVRGVPSTVFALGAPLSATSRELYRQRYLWQAPSVLQAGKLSSELGLVPTAWEDALQAQIDARCHTRQADS